MYIQRIFWKDFSLQKVFAIVKAEIAFQLFKGIAFSVEERVSQDIFQKIIRHEDILVNLICIFSFLGKNQG